MRYRNNKKTLPRRGKQLLKKRMNLEKEYETFNQRDKILTTRGKILRTKSTTRRKRQTELEPLLHLPWLREGLR